MKTLTLILCLFIFGCNSHTEQPLISNRNCGVGKINIDLSIEPNIIITPDGSKFKVLFSQRGTIQRDEVYSYSYNPATEQLFLFRQFVKPQLQVGFEFAGNVTGELIPGIAIRVKEITQ